MVFLCIRRRNRNQAPPAQHLAPRPPATFDQSQSMQEQNPHGGPGYQSSMPPGYAPQTGYLNPQTPGSNHATLANHGPSSPTKSHFEHRTSTTTNPFSSVPSTVSGDHQNHGSENGYFHPSPTPTPAIPETDYKHGNPDLVRMTQSQSPPPTISEVPGTSVSPGRPIQNQQGYNQPSQGHNPNYQSYNNNQGQQMHGYTHAQEMPTGQPGPWELGQRE